MKMVNSKEITVPFQSRIRFWSISANSVAAEAEKVAYFRSGVTPAGSRTDSIIYQIKAKKSVF